MFVQFGYMFNLKTNKTMKESLIKLAQFLDVQNYLDYCNLNGFITLEERDEMKEINELIHLNY